MRLKAKSVVITAVAAAALAGVAVTAAVITHNVQSGEDSATAASAAASTAALTTQTEAFTDASSAIESLSQNLNVAPLSGLEVETVTDSSASLKWDTAEGAQGYSVYCRNAETDGDFELCADTTDESYTVSELEGATEYEFKVVGYADAGGEKSEGESQTVTAATTLGSVSLDLSAGYSTVTLKWSQASGADGYELYKSVNDGEYSLYRDLSADATSLEDSDVSGGTKYAYQIRALYNLESGTEYTDYSTASCIVAIAPLDFTLTTTGSKLTVSWDESSANPDGYELYYSTSEGGDYTLLTSTQDASYTTEKLTLGQKYYFKLYAFKYCGQNDGEKYVNECKTAGITIGGEPEEEEETSTTQSSSSSSKKSSGSGSSDSYDSSNGETYIKVSISKQHMWFYKNGKLLVDTPVVTGNYGTNDTPRGTYYIISKKSPAVLMEDSHVTYWMPFTYSGCGIHDASWRSSYGGTIYKGNGSHGCVNTPYSAVETIYKNVSVGTTVIVE